ncbi:MAG TPA: hypothetical protein P5079_06295 [Elusimicrobiota bacterium]|nr:hypothetical protein [Elusimicrobiota bacterium]
MAEKINSRRSLLLPVFFFLALLPFVQRPLFFDDAAFFSFAKGALASPLRPYDFSADLSLPDQPVWKFGSFAEFTHPPLVGWALAVPLGLFGEKSAPLHVAVFLVAALVFFVGRSLMADFTKRPFFAVLFFAASPAFFLTSLTLYAQMFYLLFYLLTLWSFQSLAGWKRWLGCGACLALAALSHHQWPALVLILGIRALSMRGAMDGAWRSAWIGAAVFVIFYGGWSLWETKVYGMPNFVSSYRVRAVSAGGYPWRAAFLPFVFMAAAVPGVFYSWFFIFKRGRRLGLFPGILLPLAALFFASPWGGFSSGQSTALAVFLSTGFCFLIAAVLFLKGADAKDRFLVGWFLVEYGFLQRYLVFPSGHHLMMLAFPAVLLSVRMAEMCGVGRKFFWWAGGIMSALTLFLAAADYSQACVGPRVAKDFPAPTERSFYWGNVFGAYGHHLKAAGWKPYDRRVPPRAGDYVLVPRHVNAQGPSAHLRQYPFYAVHKLTYDQKIPVRTCSMVHLAGWYSASWGVLPYVFAAGPVEEFMLLQCGRPKDVSGGTGHGRIPRSF